METDGCRHPGASVGLRGAERQLALGQLTLTDLGLLTMFLYIFDGTLVIFVHISLSLRGRLVLGKELFAEISSHEQNSF